MTLNFAALRTIASNPLIQSLVTSLSSSRGGPWLVGGAVRDLLTGNRPQGFDILAACDVMTVATDLSKELNTPFKFVDSTFCHVKIESKAGDFTFSRLSSGESLEDNLSSRDFTVNSLAVPLDKLFQFDFGIDAAGSHSFIVDINSGLDDLSRKLLRPNKWTTVTDEPYVILRGIELCCRLGYSFVSTVRGQVTAGKLRGLNRNDNQFWMTLIKLLKQQNFPSLEYFVGMNFFNKVIKKSDGQVWSDESYCDKELLTRRLEVFEKLTVSHLWARSEHGKEVALLAENYRAELVFLLATYPGLYSEGKFVRCNSAGSGTDLVSFLTETGCKESAFLENIGVIYNDIEILGESKFPFTYPKNLVHADASDSSCKLEINAAGLVLACAYVAENKGDEMEDLIYAKSSLAKLFFSSSAS